MTLLPPVARESVGLNPARAAEVITALAAGEARRGSGYLVTSRLVLTAKHILAGASSVRVRFNADQPGQWSAQAELAWSPPDLDIALLRIHEESVTPPGAAPEVAGARLGAITRPPAPCEAIGFPRFKLRKDHARPGPDGKPSQYRDAHHAIGTATGWSNLRQGTLEVNVRAPEYAAHPGRSPWEGMSGAAVFSGGCLIGVIGEHHPNDGLGTLAAYPIERWYQILTADQIAELVNLIGVPTSSEQLVDVSGSAPADPPRQLPVATSAFVGREDELKRLLALAKRTWASGDPGTVVISAIDGLGGVGKTELALHASHVLAERFPDGQLFVNLQGAHDFPPRSADEVLAEFLQSYGIPPQLIPPEAAARASAYRNRLAGSRTLIVLDNAADEAQIRPLLPSTPGCLVLITSRKHLTGLDDAQPLSLDVLPLPDAIELFRKIADLENVPADDPLLRQVAELCDRLPLAVRIVASLFRNRRVWTLQHLVDKLQASDTGLAVFFDGDRNLAAVFDLSYRNLHHDQQTLFRRLGQVPGPDADVYAAAALLDTDPDAAERLLQDLVDHSVLTEPATGRYRPHDLIRRHARALASHDPADQSNAATERLLEYYRHTAGRADALIARHTKPEPAGPAPAHAPTLPDPDTALAWLRAERANLLACLELAVSGDRGGLAVGFSAGLASLLRTDGPWARAVDLHTQAITMARQFGDRVGEAQALLALGVVRQLTGDYPDAVEASRQALETFRDLGDRLGQAQALNELGVVYWMSDNPRATEMLEQALDIFKDLGDRLGQANALNDLGMVRQLTGDYPDAAEMLQQALTIFQDLGDRLGQANALNYLGLARWVPGDYPGATEVLDQALGIFQDLGDRLGQAKVLNYLGIVRQLTGDYPGSTRALQQALDIAHDLGNRLGEANALNNMGAGWQLNGEYPAAEGAFGQAFDIFHDLGDRDSEANTLNNMGEVRWLSNDYPGATHVLNQALDIYRSLGNRHGEASALMNLGVVQQLTGDYPGAGQALQQALDIARDVGNTAFEAEVLNHSGTLCLKSGNPQKGLIHHRHALELADSGISQLELARAHRGVGRCAMEMGDLANALAEFRTALAIYRRIDHAEAAGLAIEVARMETEKP